MDSSATNTIQGTEAAKFTFGRTAVGTCARRVVPAAAVAGAIRTARKSLASPPSGFIG